MISKSKLKDIRSLHLPKFRQMYDKFIAEGEKVAIELLNNRKYNVDDILITASAAEKYQKIFDSNQVSIISDKEMASVSALKSPSDILLVLQRKEDSLDYLSKQDTCAIYLDGVQDPGNVGTIIRVADWFGIDGVIRSEDTADFFQPKVVQASMGSMVNVQLSTSRLAQIMPYNKPVYGTYMNGQSLSTVKISKNAIIVMGSEGRGITKENEPFIHHHITINGHPSKVAESLNVSVAAGIICGFWKG